jgi:hypothetical protein
MEFRHSEGIMQPGSAVQVFTHGRWREATVKASEEGAFQNTMAECPSEDLLLVEDQ